MALQNYLHFYYPFAGDPSYKAENQQRAAAENRKATSSCSLPTSLLRRC